jgi:hypothetical protein
MEEIQRMFCVSINFQFIVSVAKNGFKKYMGKLSFNSERLRLALTRPVPDSFEVCQILGKTKASLLKLLNFLDDIAIKLRNFVKTDSRPELFPAVPETRRMGIYGGGGGRAAALQTLLAGLRG